MGTTAHPQKKKKKTTNSTKSNGKPAMVFNQKHRDAADTKPCKMGPS